MKKIRLILITALVAFLLAACGSNNESNTDKNNGSNETISITHELDKDPVTVKKNPEKVVVFDFGMLDTLDKMGIEVTGVPQANIPPYLSKYEDSKYVNVGGLKEPDFEKIAEIGPDLIIISGRQAELYEDLKEIAPTIYVGLDTSKYMESFKNNLKLIGEIFGKEDMVESELKAIEDRIAAVKEKVTSIDKNALILLANDGEVSAYGTGSRFGLIHDVLGFKPADENIEVSTHGQKVSFEYVLETNPDYIFVVDRTAVVGGETAAKDLVENELVKNTNAYKNNKIFYLDPNYWYLSGGGLISVSEMISEIEKSVE